MKLFITICLFLTLQLAEASELRPGFYRVSPENTVFGKYIHLHTQDVLRRNQIHKITRGSFGIDGEITENKWIDYHNSASEGVFDFNQLHLTYVGIKADSAENLTLQTKYIAHRGFSYFPPYNKESIYPANTLQAFSAALDAGYSGFEFDLRVTSDQEFLVSHDENLKIATDCNAKVHEKTLTDLLSCNVVASTLIPEFSAISAPTQVKIASLRQVFELFLSNTSLEHMVLDIKPDTDENLVSAYRKAIGDFLNHPEFLQKFLVISFYPPIIPLTRFLGS